MKRLTFALDFDDTFTACPELWSDFVQKSKELGHSWYMVTARRNTEENVETINALLDDWGCQMPIVFSNLGSKLDVMRDRGLKVDIWIDDSPHAIVHGH